VKWGYRCERIELTTFVDTLGAPPAFRRIGSLLHALFRPFRRPTDRTTRV
jgi:hypothetical protein